MFNELYEKMLKNIQLVSGVIGLIIGLLAAAYLNIAGANDTPEEDTTDAS